MNSGKWKFCSRKCFSEIYFMNFEKNVLEIFQKKSNPEIFLKSIKQSFLKLMGVGRKCCLGSPSRRVHCKTFSTPHL